MNRPAVTAYLMVEPFAKALERVRESLQRADLSIVAELDVSERIKRQLCLGFAPCRILLVDSPYLLLEALALDRSAASFLPLHVVISGRGAQTLVQWMSAGAIEHGKLPVGTAGPLEKLQQRLSLALQGIAIRQEWFQAVS